MNAIKIPFNSLTEPMIPSIELAAIIGTKPMSRTEITKRLWDYIKAHNLQNSKSKRVINLDTKLKLVFDNRTKVSIFEITKLIDVHLHS